MKQIYFALMLYMTLFLLSGCGLKGPLYVPEATKSTKERVGHYFVHVP